MKKILTLLLALAAFVPMYAQMGEKQLNRRYQNEIRDSLTHVITGWQRAMQYHAESTLIELPNDQKLYDESFISVGLDLIDTFYADGNLHLDLVYKLSYNCKHLEGYTDDYPLGTYDVDSSNSCRAICNLTKWFFQNTLADVYAEQPKMNVTVTSSADGTEFTNIIPYYGQYGDFRYCPVLFNGERIRISVDRNTGINNNCQLAYIRAQSVRHYLEENIPNFRSSNPSYHYITQSYSDSSNTHYYRRSSIEIRFSDVFSETIEHDRVNKMQDDLVDYNIPTTKRKTPNTYVLIVANENYNNPLIPNVPYASNDGQVLREYCVKTLGVPERQVKLISNASKQTIEQEGIHWLADIAKAVATKSGEETVPQANLIVYYAGHGFVDNANAAYLMPVGIDCSDISSLQPGKKKNCKLFGGSNDNSGYDIQLSGKETQRLANQCVSIDALCASFKGVPVKDLTLILDASFNGTQRNGYPMVRPEGSDDKKKKRKANMRSDAVVLLAADYDKTAFSYDDQSHGFLTYFLLREMKQRGDRFLDLDYIQVFQTLAPKINKESALQNKWQEISGLAGGKYKDGSWQSLKLN